MNPLKVSYIDDNNYDIEIEISLQNVSNDISITYIAAAPADTMTNFSGSGLPYASKEQAYYNTPNKGTVKFINNIGTLRLQKPNSYYKDFNKLQKPHVLLFIGDKQIADILIKTEHINNRSLQYGKKEIYSQTKYVMSQEDILKSKSYKANLFLD